jgi:hypothetical protein
MRFAFHRLAVNEEAAGMLKITRVSHKRRGLTIKLER